MKHLDINRGNLKGLYEQAKRSCPLLARLEATARTQEWTEEEILMIQVVVACESNKSLSEEIQKLRNQNKVVNVGQPVLDIDG